MDHSIGKYSQANLDALAKAKEEGKVIVGTYCTYTPNEIIMAAGAIPIGQGIAFATWHASCVTAIGCSRNAVDLQGGLSTCMATRGRAGTDTWGGDVWHRPVWPVRAGPHDGVMAAGRGRLNMTTDCGRWGSQRQRDRRSHLHCYRERLFPPPRPANRGSL